MCERLDNTCGEYKFTMKFLYVLFVNNTKLYNANLDEKTFWRLRKTIVNV